MTSGHKRPVPTLIATASAPRTNVSEPAHCLAGMPSPSHSTIQRLSATANENSAAQQITRLSKHANAQVNPAAQRVRIRLANNDLNLMKALRNVKVNNEGSEVVNGVSQVSDVEGLDEIGKTENIVFEGHGNTNERGQTHGQGGYAPDFLARFAHGVPKPKDWSGQIILLGCATGAITQEVSKEYFKLTKQPVTVTGTHENVKIGKDESGESFVGSDWADSPKREHPNEPQFAQNLETAQKIEDAVRAFHRKVVLAMLENMRAIDKSDDEIGVVVPNDVLNLQLDAYKLVADGTKDPIFQYGTRVNYVLKFNKIIDDLLKDVDVHVGYILRAKSKSKKLPEISDEYALKLHNFTKEWNPVYLKLLQQMLGIRLKRVDLTDPNQVEQSRMEDKSMTGGMFGRSWNDAL